MAKEKCLCGDCCGCKGCHEKGLCPHPKCSKFKAVPTPEEIKLFASDQAAACQAFRERCGIGMIDAMKALRDAAPRENILDIMAEIDAVGDGDKSHLNARVQKMEGEIASSGKDLSHYIQPLSAEEVAEQQQVERDQQIDAAARGERPSLPGEYPRISDFLIVDTAMAPEAMLKIISEEVFGNYDAQDYQGRAEFGVMVLRHKAGQVPAGGLPMGTSQGKDLTTPTRDMVIVKLDAGPWKWYDDLAIAMAEAIVRRVGRRAWRCGWALDKQWSWVEHWRVDSKTAKGKMTETLDGPANATVTNRARERWGIDVRAAFDDLMRVAQWEALRQWLLTPEPRQTPFAAHVSFLAGKLLIQDKDREWVEPKWREFFPGRQPQDGPLHLQAYYVTTPKSAPTKAISKDKLVSTFRREPPLLE